MPDDALRLPCPTMARTAAPSSCKPGLTLCDLPLGAPAEVQSVDVKGDAEARDLALRLLEIGFVPGEAVRVIAHGHPGREPVAVRVGGTTFALRRFEAERVLVELKSPGASVGAPS